MDNLLIALFSNPLLVILLISCFPLYISGFCLFFGAMFPAVKKEDKDKWTKKRRSSLIWGIVMIALAMVPSIIVTAVCLHTIGI